MTEIQKHTAPGGRRVQRGEVRGSSTTGRFSPMSQLPDERPLVRLLLGERKGRTVTVLLFPPSDDALSRLLASQLAHFPACPFDWEAGQAVFPGDCRQRLRTELRHRGIRVKG